MYIGLQGHATDSLGSLIDVADVLVLLSLLCSAELARVNRSLDESRRRRLAFCICSSGVDGTSDILSFAPSVVHDPCALRDSHMISFIVRINCRSVILGSFAFFLGCDIICDIAIERFMCRLKL